MNDKIHNAISSTAAAGIGLGAYVYGGKVLAAELNKVAKVPHPALSKEEIAEIREACYHMYSNEGFNLKKTEIVEASIDKNKAEIEKYLKNLESKYEQKVQKIKIPFFRKLKEKSLARKLKNIRKKYNQYINGSNACYIRNIHNKNAILINMQKCPHFFAHELGHALNHRKLGKIASVFIYNKLHLVAKHNKILFGIFAISMLTNKKKPEESKKDNTFKSLLQFIKNNGGKLSVLAGTPLLIEEGMANIHGQRLAKKYMNPKFMKLMTKTHINSFASYSKNVAFAGVILYAANKVRDTSYKFLKNLNN